jgi:hypothetical protein
MKKLIILFVLASVFAGCSDWLDVNDDPNIANEMTIEYVLPSAQASIATQLGGTLFNIGGFYAQYWTQAPEGNQYTDVDKFDIKSDLLDNVYTELYAGALNDLEYIRHNTNNTNDHGNYLVATVLRAYTFQILVDLFSKVPYSEALDGYNKVNPKFDAGSDVYKGIIAEVNHALELVHVNSSVVSSDLLLGGDVDEWIGFANALKLKIYMRQSETGVNHEKEIKALLSKADFMSQDIKFTSFQDEQNKRNPWYDTEIEYIGGVNHIATKNIISYMQGNNDPRIDVIWQKATKTNDYKGNYPGGSLIENIENADFSFPLLSSTTPVCLYSLAELYLFIAEAELRYNNDLSAAQSAYEAAVDASLSLHGLSVNGDDLYGNGKPFAFDGTLKQIAMQKWACLAMVNHIESWFEINRTDFPSVSSSTVEEIMANNDLYSPGDRIVPYENSLGEGNLLTRFYYPDVAISRNINAPAQVKLTDKVWWDKN